jgi:hypothetical protein
MLVGVIVESEEGCQTWTFPPETAYANPFLGSGRVEKQQVDAGLTLLKLIMFHCDKLSYNDRATVATCLLSQMVLW